MLLAMIEMVAVLETKESEMGTMCLSWERLLSVRFVEIAKERAKEIAVVWVVVGDNVEVVVHACALGGWGGGGVAEDVACGAASCGEEGHASRLDQAHSFHGGQVRS